MDTNLINMVDMVLPRDMLWQIALMDINAYNVMICADRWLNQQLRKVDIAATFCIWVEDLDILDQGTQGWRIRGEDARWYRRYEQDVCGVEITCRGRIGKALRYKWVNLNDSYVSSYIIIRTLRRFGHDIVAGTLHKYEEIIEYENGYDNIISAITRTYRIDDIIKTDTYYIVTGNMRYTTTMIKEIPKYKWRDDGGKVVGERQVMREIEYQRQPQWRITGSFWLYDITI